MTFTAEQSHEVVSRYETTSQLRRLDLSLIDSVVTLSPRDTLRSVRYVKLSASLSASDTAASLALRRDSSAAVSEQVIEKPLLAESNKRGQRWLRPLCFVGCVALFAIFFALFLALVKIFVYLQRKIH